VAKYLTQDWLDETRDLAVDQPERPGATVRMNWVIQGAGAGGEDTAYYWIVENGRLLDSRLGALDDAEVTLSMPYADAVAIARLDLDLNAAFMQGRVKVTGNMAKFMSLLPLTKAPEYRALMEKVKDCTEF